MFAELSGFGPPGVLCCPGSPGVFPACAQPKLTLSFSVRTWVNASHVALLRVRSFCDSRSEGSFLLVLSHSALTVVLDGNVYCPPILYALSSPMSLGSRLARSLVRLTFLCIS